MATARGALMFDGCCGGMGWMMAWGAVIGILLIGLLVGLIVYALTGRRGPAPSTDPMTILRERFARGEIDQAEYEQRARGLRGDPGPSDPV